MGRASLVFGTALILSLSILVLPIPHAAAGIFQPSGVSDVDGPSITDIRVSPSVAQPRAFVSIGATIADSSVVAGAWIVVEGPDVNLNITLVRFGDQWFLNRSWEAAGTYQFVIGAEDVVGNVNTASGSFLVEGSLAGTFGLLVLLGAPLAIGAGALVYLWVRRPRTSDKKEPVPE